MTEQMAPFQPGDNVVRTRDFEFDPDLDTAKVHTVEYCMWDGEEWILKLQDNDYVGYDPDNFAFVPKQLVEPGVAPKQYVFAVLDERIGQYMGCFATYHGAMKAICERLTNASEETQNITPVQFEIERIEVKQ